MASARGCDQDRAEVIDVGARGSGDHGIAQRAKKGVGVVCVQCSGGVLAQRGGALQRVGRGNGASHGLQAVDAVGVASY